MRSDTTPSLATKPQPSFTAAATEQIKSAIHAALGGNALDRQTAITALQALLGEAPDRFTFAWAGKSEAMRLLRAVAVGALHPAQSDSRNFMDTGNIYIEGENLEALKLLQASYFGMIKMIYIDPPYNTGNDFIYPDSFETPLAQYLQITGQHDTDGNLVRSNPETSGRYHSAWLSMMYPRLVYARQLLREDGAICVSIGEEELANLRLLMNEVFGEEQYRNTIVVRRYDKNLNRQFIDRGLKTLNIGVEYVLVYGRSDAFTLNPVYREASERRKNNGYWKGFWNSADRPTMRYKLLGVTPSTGQWKWQRSVAQKAVDNYDTYLKTYSQNTSLEEYWQNTGRQLKFIRRNPSGKGQNKGVEHWIPPANGILRSSNWTDLLASDSAEADLPFDNPKNVTVIEQLIEMCTDDGDTILDFFAGYSTTACAVMGLNDDTATNRRFICIQLPEPTQHPKYSTLTKIGRARINRFAEHIERERKREKLEPIDTGYVTLRLEESVFRTWQDISTQVSDTEYETQLSLMVDRLRPGIPDIDIIFEVSLKEGFGATPRVSQYWKGKRGSISRIESRETGDAFYVSLDARITDEHISAVSDLEHEVMFVCRETALTDSLAASIATLIRLRTI